jgi:hypothetical protein
MRLTHGVYAVITIAPMMVTDWFFTLSRIRMVSSHTETLSVTIEMERSLRSAG